MGNRPLNCLMRHREGPVQINAQLHKTATATDVAVHLQLSSGSICWTCISQQYHGGDRVNDGRHQPERCHLRVHE